MRARSVAIVALSLVAGSAAPGAVIFVNAGLGTGANNGDSWSDAFRGRLGLKNALNVAQAGDEVWVAQGTYAPATAGGDLSASFIVASGVRVLGGFAGGESDAAQRDSDAHVTVLTGDLNSNDGAQDGPENDNSFHVVQISNANASTVLDGLTIEGGLADTRAGGSDPPFREGGGILIQNSSPVIRRCRVRNSTAGTFGGGISVIGGSITVENCAFTGGRAPVGANMSSRALASTSVRRCTFIESDVNENTVRGGGIASGAALTTAGDASHIEIEDCYFSIQELPFLAADGLGVHVGGGTANIRRCAFVRNIQVGGGGGISVGTFAEGPGTSATIDRCVFVGNEASFDGGAAVYGHVGSTILLTNSVFTGNDRTGFCTIFSQGEEIMLTNCTIANNGSPSAFHAAVLLTGGVAVGSINNSIIWSNQSSSPSNAAMLPIGPTSISVNRSLVQGWTGQYPGVGTVNANPMFVDADGADNIAGTEDDDLRLSPGSPGIDRGDNSFIAAWSADLDGCPRRRDDPATVDTGVGAPPVVDAGAYEFVVKCAGDANGDAAIGLADIAAVIQGWGAGAGDVCRCVDLDGSGTIGLGDIAAVIQNWGGSCS
ncbi:MAG TPA: right-handed parallel beta-helix repeat-containing protein [Phycisphaerales bacterium]|nr:right-handed parallel beta-helix repeat-containing protein [Phycisphaerales bacterium]